MKVRYLTIYFFAFIASVWFYFNFDIEMISPSQAVGQSDIPEDILFEMQVQEWSVELSESMESVQVTPDSEGNCLPVAAELQKRIVDSGRIAFIGVVYPETIDTGHAIVVYSSKVAGRLDSVIDNGFSTYNKVLPKDFLDTGVFGEYAGTCQGPDVTKGTCERIGLAW